jgi:hypothetical protein
VGTREVFSVVGKFEREKAALESLICDYRPVCRSAFTVLNYASLGLSRSVQGRRPGCHDDT